MTSLLNKFVEKLNTLYRHGTRGAYVLEPGGRQYAKIVRRIASSTSVWGFVVLKTSAANPHLRVGDLLLASSWKSPSVKNPRGNIIDGTDTHKWTGPVYMSTTGKFNHVPGRTNRGILVS